MNRERFESVTARYAGLRVAVVGDFCLDRYLEIDPARAELSIETGLPVHNVVRVRAQPGGAGTILCNLGALGVRELWPVGFCGDDGEGYELRRALSALPGVRLDHFLQTPDRRTFTYCKPLVLAPGQSPQELNRLDSKNWTPTPADVETQIADALRGLATHVDAIILLDQVDLPDTGVLTKRVVEAVREIATAQPPLPILADSRQGLRGWPSVIFKMNAAELAQLAQTNVVAPPDEVRQTAAQFAQRNGRPVFVSLAERGIVGATPDGASAHVPAQPVRGEIDIVGAGDAVLANLACALASGAALHESLELANAAASVVIHQLGTTGTASIAQLRERLL